MLYRTAGQFKTTYEADHALFPVRQDAWLLASVDFGSARVRSGHLILALLTSDGLARIAREISKEFAHISAESLQANLQEVTDRREPP